MEPILAALTTEAVLPGPRGFAWSKLIDAGGDLAINLAVVAILARDLFKRRH